MFLQKSTQKLKERHKSARRPSPFERVKQKKTTKNAQNDSRNADLTFKPKRGTLEDIDQSINLLEQKPTLKYDKDPISIEKFDPTSRGQKVSSQNNSQIENTGFETKEDLEAVKYDKKLEEIQAKYKKAQEKTGNI